MVAAHDIADTDAAAHTGPNGLVDRTLGILELLARHAHGLPLFEVADELGIPRSATHRILTSLAERGYVRQQRSQRDYRLTAKIASLGFIFLAGTGIIDLAQPILDDLAQTTGELVRLAVIDDRSLTWVAKAQGSPHGLRYDPDMGQVARLSCSSSGLAWLATMADADALAIVAAQGFGDRADYGPRAPHDETSFLKALRATRRRGYSLTVQTFAPGMAAAAAAIRHPMTGEVTGTVSIAGPHLRLTEARLVEFAPLLLDAAQALSEAAAVAPPRAGPRRDIFAETGKLPVSGEQPRNRQKGAAP